MKIIYTIIAIYFSGFVFSQNIQTTTGLKDATSALGYLLGQEFTLNNIKKDYPNLRANVIEAELLFKKSFGKARDNIESLISKKFSKDQLTELKSKIVQEFLNLNINSINTEDKAELFIDEVKNRANGNIQSPIFEIILCYNFYNNPEQEYLNNFIQVFDTKNHKKSKGTDWSIKVPISWVAQEADRPNIIQKFISEGGNGNESIMMMVKDLPKEYKFTAEEIEAFFTENEVRGMIPENGKFISFKKMTFDGVNGGVMNFEVVTKRLDIEVISIMTQFMFIHNQQLYTVNCSVPIGNAPFYSKPEKFSTLFRLVANSIIVHGQY